MKYAQSLDGIDMPHRIAALPICPTRKMPIPWFVAWVDGKPEFRAADGKKFDMAINPNRPLCWVCGEPLGKYKTFLLGPMCVVNRISAEPPMHLECAEFSAKACPFLTKPHMDRREAGMPEGGDCAGIMIKRNPGCVVSWTTTQHWQQKDNGGILFRVGEPCSWSTWAEGREATKDEIAESIRTGLPILENMCAGEADRKELQRLTDAACMLLGVTLEETANE